MEVGNDAVRKTARRQAELAAQWLHLLGFAAYPGAPAFSPSVSHYHAMLDPKAGDKARLEACYAMLDSVQRRLPAEEFEGLATYKNERPVDPYGKAWRTTRAGAELWMIAHLLATATAGFEQALENS